MFLEFFHAFKTLFRFHSFNIFVRFIWESCTSISYTRRWTTEYTEWQWPHSGVHSYHDGKISPAWVGGGGARHPPFTLSTITSKVELWCTLQLRGHKGASILNFFWNFNRNHSENDRYWQKNNFLLFAKCLKMYSFFRFCILGIQKVLLWRKKFFSWKISIWVSKKCRILCWFQIRWRRISEMPLTKVKSKKPRKNAQKRKYSKFA